MASEQKSFFPNLPDDVGSYILKKVPYEHNVRLVSTPWAVFFKKPEHNFPHNIIGLFVVYDKAEDNFHVYFKGIHSNSTNPSFFKKIEDALQEEVFLGEKNSTNIKKSVYRSPGRQDRLSYFCEDVDDSSKIVYEEDNKDDYECGIEFNLDKSEFSKFIKWIEESGIPWVTKEMVEKLQALELRATPSDSPQYTKR